MHTFSFTFYKNSKEDEKGRLIAMMDGFQAGDPLQIAYRGFVQHQHAATMEDAETVARSVADKIYCLFNHPDARPVNYRGPSHEHWRCR